MFSEFYGLGGNPFGLTPDRRFFFGSAGHGRAVAHLAYGLSQEEGFIVITGEVGAGKTTLVERLCAELDPRTFLVARMPTLQVTGAEVLPMVAAALGLPGGEATTAALRRVETLLRDRRGAGARTLLVVDEVQGLSVPALEELRMLSNASHEGRALMQILLLGQPQFRRTMASPELDQLRQRVIASFHLGPLTEAETAEYVMHRLRAVGWSGRPAWAQGALAAVYAATGGIPRRINRLCSRLLLHASLEEREELDPDTVATVDAELQRDLADVLTPGTPEELGGAEGSLANRLAALEQAVGRQNRVFERLAELFAPAGAAPR